jgi:hypothetical protein
MRQEYRTSPRAASRVPRTVGPTILGRLLSASGTLILLVGVPAVLVGMHLSPPFQELARAATHPQWWGHVLRSPLDDDAVVKVVALVAWLAWLWLALCIAVELLANVKGVPTVHLPGSRYAQSLAACLVGACVALLPAARVTPQLRFSVVEVSASHPNAFGPELDDEWITNLSSTGPPTPLRETPAPPSTESTIDPASAQTYVVQPGDTLWSIASRELGSPLQWRQLAEVNMGRLQPDGQ